MTTRIWFFLLLSFLPGVLLAADLSVTNLKTEYTATPLGIDVVTPRFSWQLAAAPNQPRGSRQLAYQLRVTNEAGEVVWNTGKVANSTSLNVPYAGKPLAPTTRYTWAVTVWDQQNVSPHGYFLV